MDFVESRAFAKPRPEAAPSFVRQSLDERLDIHDAGVVGVGASIGADFPKHRRRLVVDVELVLRTESHGANQGSLKQALDHRRPVRREAFDATLEFGGRNDRVEPLLERRRHDAKVLAEGCLDLAFEFHLELPHAFSGDTDLVADSFERGGRRLDQPRPNHDAAPLRGRFHDPVEAARHARRQAVRRLDDFVDTNRTERGRQPHPLGEPKQFGVDGVRERPGPDQLRSGRQQRPQSFRRAVPRCDPGLGRRRFAGGIASGVGGAFGRNEWMTRRTEQECLQSQQQVRQGGAPETWQVEQVRGPEWGVSLQRSGAPEAVVRASRDRQRAEDRTVESIGPHQNGRRHHRAFMDCTQREGDLAEVARRGVARWRWRLAHAPIRYLRG